MCGGLPSVAGGEGVWQGTSKCLDAPCAKHKLSGELNRWLPLIAFGRGRGLMRGLNDCNPLDFLLALHLKKSRWACHAAESSSKAKYPVEAHTVLLTCLKVHGALHGPSLCAVHGL